MRSSRIVEKSMQAEALMSMLVRGYGLYRERKYSSVSAVFDYTRKHLPAMWVSSTRYVTEYGHIVSYTEPLVMSIYG